MLRDSQVSTTNNYRRAAAAVALGLAALMAPHAAESLAAKSPRSARASRLLSGTATAHLHLIKVEGSRLLEEGPVSGALVGSASAELNTGAVFVGRFTMHTHSGSITGHGRANPHGSGRFQSFNGSFIATSGTGRYAHVKGKAGLYGVFDRRTYSVTVQTTGQLSY